MHYSTSYPNPYTVTIVWFYGNGSLVTPTSKLMLRENNKVLRINGLDSRFIQTFGIVLSGQARGFTGLLVINITVDILGLLYLVVHYGLQKPPCVTLRSIIINYVAL